ncbi:Aconitase family (aconitate hydratase) [Mesobacillus persicus]|uniref:aconitate hydratase n=1 Tax=Mesobacillus persicus TaxID=930146 RepID=A0A1H8F0M6_9BACI|nr:aconitase family protein [Mesobacillus persicus]SEN25269.1 Aconitase family (aconitate hydratase) [Mesobacillus persicus]
MNIIEINLARCSQLDQTAPGERNLLTPDILFLSGENSLNVIRNFCELGYKAIEHPRCMIMANETAIASEHWSDIRQFSNAKGLPIIHGTNRIQVLKKQVDLLEGKVIAGVDDRVAELGALGSIPIKISPAGMAKCLATGKMQMTIPESIYVELSGRFKGTADVDAICDYLRGYFNDSLAGWGIIFGGEVISQLDEGERVSLIKQLDELGGTVAIISPSGPLGQVESVVKIKAQHILNQKV